MTPICVSSNRGCPRSSKGPKGLEDLERSLMLLKRFRPGDSKAKPLVGVALSTEVHMELLIHLVSAMTRKRSRHQCVSVKYGLWGFDFPKVIIIWVTMIWLALQSESQEPTCNPQPRSARNHLGRQNLPKIQSIAQWLRHNDIFIKKNISTLTQYNNEDLSPVNKVSGWEDWVSVAILDSSWHNHVATALNQRNAIRSGKYGVKTKRLNLVFYNWLRTIR